MSIRLHPDHGLNPSVYQCFFCGEDVGVVLVGIQSARIFGSQEAPRKCGAINHDPCDKCKSYMEQGVILISVRDGETGDNLYRTGGWVVIREDAIRRIVNPPELADDICKKRVAFIPDEAWNRLGLPRNNVPPVDAPG